MANELNLSMNFSIMCSVEIQDGHRATTRRIRDDCTGDLDLGTTK